jgi:hypothetical protein
MPDVVRRLMSVICLNWSWRTLPSFRFSGVLSFLNPYYQGGESAQLTRIDAGRWARMPILAIVPPCAGECRLVRVTSVLIFADSRTCVACVLPVAGPRGHRAGTRLRTGGLAQGSKTGCRDPHRPAGRPVAPGAIAGMTYRDERSVPQRLKRLKLPNRHAADDLECRGRTSTDRPFGRGTGDHADHRVGVHKAEPRVCASL